jgi:hypothetical protein
MDFHAANLATAYPPNASSEGKTENWQNLPSANQIETFL